MRDKPLSEREVGAQLINETVSFAESRVCRRKILLHYLGEDWDINSCAGTGGCDNCTPKEKIEAKYMDGVLKIALPFDEKAKKPAAKHIAVK